ncbi:MAG: hypothetical protein RL328_2250, partial [Acidobacteriota bacterium]
GWYYDIGEGTVDQYDPILESFVPLDQPVPQEVEQAV